MWAILRVRHRELLLGALVVFVPLGLFEALADELERPLAELDSLGPLEVLELAGSTIVHAGGALAGEVIYAGIVAGAVAAEREGAGRSLAEILRRLPIMRLVIVDLLLALVVGLGLVLLLVPGIMALVWFALAPPALKLEHLGIPAAFRRSRELVRGRFWLVFWLVVPILVAGDAATELAESGALSAFGEMLAGHWLAATLVNMVAAPPFALAVVVLFYELRGSRPGPSAA